MSKKIIILNILGMVIVGIGVLYFFAWRPQEKESEMQIERATGASYEANIDIEIPEYPGMSFVMEYRRGTLVAHYYIVKEKQDKLIDFYKNKLENFEILEDLNVGQTRHFYMSSKEMMYYDDEEQTTDELLRNSYEEFGKEGMLMTIEVGRAPFPFWDYTAFNPMRPGEELEETMLVFWFYSPKI
jgi:hypothetical protein